MADQSKPLQPTFADLLDRVVLSEQERIAWMRRYLLDPIGANWALCGLTVGQAVACRLAAEEAING